MFCKQKTGISRKRNNNIIRNFNWYLLKEKNRTILKKIFFTVGMFSSFMNPRNGLSKRDNDPIYSTLCHVQLVLVAIFFIWKCFDCATCQLLGICMWVCDPFLPRNKVIYELTQQCFLDDRFSQRSFNFGERNLLVVLCSILLPTLEEVGIRLLKFESFPFFVKACNSLKLLLVRSNNESC